MTNDVAQKHAKLVQRLYIRTKQGTTPWKLDENRNPEAQIGSYMVTIWHSSGGAPLEWVSLATLYGETIESFSDEDLSELTPPGPDFDSYYNLMGDLRAAAFRQAVGADKALDDILNNLDDDF